MYKPFRPFGRGPTTPVRGLTNLIMNYFLNGMILQVPSLHKQHTTLKQQQTLELKIVFLNHPKWKTGGKPPLNIYYIYIYIQPSFLPPTHPPGCLTKPQPRPAGSAPRHHSGVGHHSTRLPESLHPNPRPVRVVTVGVLVGGEDGKKAWGI